MKSILFLAGISFLPLLAAAQSPLKSAPGRFLIFSKTAAFHHDSIPIGIQTFLDLAEENGMAADSTTDASVFNDQTLDRYDAVVFLNTTGDVLNADQQAAFERYIRSGGGYAGVHAASDTEYEWPWYGQLVGAYFVNHPAIQEAKLNVVDHDHPSTEHLPGVWTRTDEWYNLRYVNDAVRVLITLDETSYKQRNGESGNAYHPHAWYHEFDGGRSFYTAMGHTIESYSEPDFKQHLLGGLRYAMGAIQSESN